MNSKHDQKPDPARREVIFLVSSGAAAQMLGCGGGASSSPASASSTSSSSSSASSSSTCVVRPQLTEGPYYVDEMLNRSDLRSDPSDGTVRPGVSLHLTFRVSRAGTCAALAGALVDVWHCDALGVYSDVRDGGFNTVGQRFLRGYQLTDTSGLAQFMTIYPGWYSGRAVHIHFKIRSAPGASSGFEFTSQLFFDETVTDQVHAQAPYNSKGRRNTLNTSDGIYRGGGSQLLLPLVAEGSGYGATFDIALQL
jgi:protocatechuate 3,4-dioxygenase beta subunit